MLHYVSTNSKLFNVYILGMCVCVYCTYENKDEWNLINQCHEMEGCCTVVKQRDDGLEIIIVVIFFLLNSNESQGVFMNMEHHLQSTSFVYHFFHTL